MLSRSLRLGYGDSQKVILTVLELVILFNAKVAMATTAIVTISSIELTATANTGLTTVKPICVCRGFI